MKNIEDLHVLVVGDVMLDEYIIGDVERISPEAPVPIVNISKKYTTLGGCGNVVKNLSSIGAKVSCITQVGYDDTGEIIESKLNDICEDTIIFKIGGEYKTSKKTRVMSKQREMQLLRIDDETLGINPGDSYFRNILQSKIDISEVDIIVVSDYAKGFICEYLMDFLKKWYKRIIVDPKPSNFPLYRYTYMITPNEKEYKEMMKHELIGTLASHEINWILRTEGKNGMSIFDGMYDNEPKHIEAEPVDVYNVSGAGDTVVAIMSICLSMNMNPLESAMIANECANYVVQQSGTSTIPRELFNNIVLSYSE